MSERCERNETNCPRIRKRGAKSKLRQLRQLRMHNGASKYSTPFFNFFFPLFILCFNCGMDHFNFAEKIAFYRIRLRNEATREKGRR